MGAKVVDTGPKSSDLFTSIRVPLGEEGGSGVTSSTGCAVADIGFPMGEKGLPGFAGHCVSGFMCSRRFKPFPSYFHDIG